MCCLEGKGHHWFINYFRINNSLEIEFFISEHNPSISVRHSGLIPVGLSRLADSESSWYLFLLDTALSTSTRSTTATIPTTIPGQNHHTDYLLVITHEHS